MKKIVFILFFYLVACDVTDDNNGVVCTQQFVYGLNITVKDTNTNSIITDNIIVMAKDGNYEETLMTIEGIDSFFGAGERPGNYVIIVTSDNYQTYVSERITVDADKCHVIPESVEILLQPN